MTQDLLLNLMPSLPFGEASGPLVAAMYSGRLKRSDLEVRACWHTNTHGDRARPPNQAAPRSVLDALLTNTRPDVLQRIRPILPDSYARGRIAQETYSPVFDPVPQGGDQLPGFQPPPAGTPSPSGGSNNDNSQASGGVTYNTVPGSPAMGASPGSPDNSGGASFPAPMHTACCMSTPS